jgi:nitroreductase
MHFTSRPSAREEPFMELYDVMRTAFAAREFTDDPLPDATLFKILENARFAPSGGNRQGWYVIIVRDRTTREALAALTAPAAKRYVAQQQTGESPWNSVNPTRVDEATVARTPAPARLTEPVLRAAVVLVVCVDLQVVASTDQYLDRVGVISGASIYPFAWNILLAARHEGYGGTLTTLAVAEEPKIQELLGLPAHVAVCAVMPLGKPITQITRLRRKAVSAFAMHERWGGAPLTDSQCPR